MRHDHLAHLRQSRSGTSRPSQQGSHANRIENSREKQACISLYIDTPQMLTVGVDRRSRVLLRRTSIRAVKSSASNRQLESCSAVFALKSTHRTAKHNVIA